MSNKMTSTVRLVRSSLREFFYFRALCIVMYWVLDLALFKVGGERRTRVFGFVSKSQGKSLDEQEKFFRLSIASEEPLSMLCLC